MDTVLREHTTALRGARTDNEGNRDALGKAMREVVARMTERAKAILSDDQKKTWEGLVGKPFKMPQIGQPPRPAN